jgi:hypothetical protein
VGFSFWAASPVRRLSEIALGLNSKPGLSHIVLAGANEDGMKEVIPCFSFCLCFLVKNQ